MPVSSQSPHSSLPPECDLSDLLPEAAPQSSLETKVEIAADLLISRIEGVDGINQALSDAIASQNTSTFVTALDTHFHTMRDLVRLRNFFDLVSAKYSTQTELFSMAQQINTLVNSAVDKALSPDIFANPQAVSMLAATPEHLRPYFYQNMTPLPTLTTTYETMDLIHSAASLFQQGQPLRLRVQQGDPLTPQENALLLESSAQALNAKLEGHIRQAKDAGFKTPLEQFLSQQGISAGALNGIYAALETDMPGILKRQAELSMLHRQRPFIAGSARSLDIPWPEACKFVEESFREFHPEMGKLAQRMFREKWIDAMPSDEKIEGQSCLPGLPASFALPGQRTPHPYILMHYHGRVEDVLTLAHEMAHAVSSYQSGKNYGLHYDVSDSLQECFTLLAEKMVLQRLIDRSRGDHATVYALRDAGLTRSRTYLLTTFPLKLQDRLYQEAAFSSDGGLTPFSQHQISAWEEEIAKRFAGERIGETLAAMRSWARDPGNSQLYHQPPYYDANYLLGELVSETMFQRKDEKGFAGTLMRAISGGGSMTLGKALSELGIKLDDPAFAKSAMQTYQQKASQMEQSFAKAALALGATQPARRSR